MLCIDFQCKVPMLYRTGHKDVDQTDANRENAPVDNEEHRETGVEDVESPVVQRRGRSGGYKNCISIF